MMRPILIILLISFAFFLPRASASCVGDVTDQQSMGPATSTHGCDGGGGNTPPPAPSCASCGSDGDTEYGANTWASAEASWDAHDANGYSGLHYRNACSSSSSQCVPVNGCVNACGSYSAKTTSYASDYSAPDAYAHIPR